MTGWSVRSETSCEGEEAPEATSAAECRIFAGYSQSSTWTRGANFTRCVRFDTYGSSDCHDDPLSDTWSMWSGPCPTPPPSPPTPPPPTLPGSSGYFAVFGETLDADDDAVRYFDKTPMPLQSSEDCHVRCDDGFDKCIGFVRDVDSGLCQRLQAVRTSDLQFQANASVNIYFFDESWVHSRNGPVAYFNQNAYPGAGGDEIDTDETAAVGLSEQECWYQCETHDLCSCVTYQPSIGKCWKRSSCEPVSFDHTSGYDVYYKYVAKTLQPEFEPLHL